MLMAQNRTVTGTVISAEDGEPVIGASVIIPGTSTGTTTDLDGNFSLNVPQSTKELSFSYVGMTTKVVAIKNGSMRITLDSDNKVLDDVVVTAQGMSRAEKTLGYSAVSVKSSDITVGNNANAMTSLQGKVAGMQISAMSSAPGAANNVIIRGFSSINGDNQPLYVVDGVPLQQSVVGSQGQNLSAGGIGNIAPDDIENMTILKGAAATALYGSRAANGVILITTKSGKRGTGHNFTIAYNYGFQARQIGYLPKMQNKWGQGWNGNQTYIENGSWGPVLNGSTQVYGPIFNNQQLIHEYTAKENNLIEFFEIGQQHSHNVSLNGMSEDGKMTYFLSYGYNNDNGVMPSDADKAVRHTTSMRVTYDAAKWLKVSSNVSVANNSIDAVGMYQGTSVIDGLYEMARDVAIRDMKDITNPFFTPQAYYTPYGITNPYWALANNYNHTDSKQVFGKIQVDAKPIKDVTLSYRFGFDYTDYDRKLGYPEIKVSDDNVQEDYGYAPSNSNQAGYVYANYARRYELNHDISAAYNHNFELNSSNAIDVNAMVGINMNERSATSMSSESDELTFETGFWQLSNGSSWTTMSESQSKRRLVGLWGTLNLGWNEKLFLDYSARNDWSSTLPIDANSFFYQGITGSYLFTEDLPKNDVLTFGKVRVAYGQTGNDADPYMTSVRYTQGYANAYYGSDVAKFPMLGLNAFQKTSSIGSSSLKPEMTTEFEVGANFGFFNGRLGLDVTYYNRTTSDQIFTLPVDPACGYSSMVTNFGKVRNRGWELVLNTTPIRTANWRWDLNFNWAKNDNKVLSLPESLEGGKVNIYSFSAGNDAIYMYAEEGRPMGEFYTYLPMKTADGKTIVGADGLPIIDTNNVVDTGKNMNNDWTGGASTTISAYGFSLSAQLDVRYGGWMFSRSKNLMQFTGNGVVTGYNDRQPFVVPNSVYEDGTPNTTPIHLSDGTYQDYFDGTGWGLGGEAYLIDRSYIKLRNISLGYSLPRKWLATTKLSELSLSLFVNNVFTWTAKNNNYVDPENTTVTGGDLAAQFGELYTNPGNRTFGFNIGVKF